MLLILPPTYQQLSTYLPPSLRMIISEEMHGRQFEWAGQEFSLPILHYYLAELEEKCSAVHPVSPSLKPPITVQGALSTLSTLSGEAHHQKNDTEHQHESPSDSPLSYGRHWPNHHPE